MWWRISGERTGKGAYSVEDAKNDQEERAGQAAENGEGVEGFPLEALTSTYLVRWFIATLTAKAWEAMGLVANPLTQETKTDLLQARIAIDAVAALLPIIEGDMEADEASKMKSVLRDLKVNYVERAKDS